MRTLGLLGLAAEAEALRLRRRAGGVMRSAAWTASAAAFGLGAAVMAHLGAWHGLLPELGEVRTAAAIAGADVLIAGVLLLVARPRRDLVAEQAASLRATMLSRAADGALGDAIRGITLQTPVAAIGGLVAEAAVSAIRRR